MLKKAIRVPVNIILILFPFFPLTEIFFTRVDQNNFPSYLLACGAISLLALMLALFLNYNKSVSQQKSKLLLSIWLLFALGISVMFPLHMGPPKENQELLKFVTEERFRYGGLIFAVILFFVSCITVLKSVKPQHPIAGKIFISVLVLATLANLWDNYSSFMFSSEMMHWVKDGKKAEDFFANYNYHITVRAFARVLLYVIAGWLSMMLVREGIFKKWEVVLLILFCTVGVGFCIAFLTIGFQYYFPFMVPAIALAPTYWIGVALLNKTSFKSKSADKS